MLSVAIDIFLTREEDRKCNCKKVLKVKNVNENINSVVNVLQSLKSSENGTKTFRIMTVSFKCLYTTLSL